VRFTLKNGDLYSGEIEILDLYGKLILEKNFEDAVFVLYLKNFPSGIYICKYKFEKQENG
jgi:hypothetical protein